MNFNLAEKLAIIKAIDEVILADGHVDRKEIGFLTKILDILRFDKELIHEARKIDAKEGLSILNAMPRNKKHTLVVILNETAFADGTVDQKEIDLISKIFSAAGID